MRVFRGSGAGRLTAFFKTSLAFFTAFLAPLTAGISSFAMLHLDPLEEDYLRLRCLGSVGAGVGLFSTSRTDFCVLRCVSLADAFVGLGRFAFFAMLIVQ